MATSVSFGETPAFDIVVDSPTSLTCTVPAGTAGTVDVRVATSYDTDTLTDAYTYVAIPEITSVNPDTAPAGEATFYTVNGTNLPAEGDPQAWFVALEPDGEPIPLTVTYSNGFPTFSVTATETGTYGLWVEDGSGTEIARLDAAITIVTAAAITSVTPTVIAVDTPTTITVTGTDLPVEGEPQAWFAALADGVPIPLTITYNASNGRPMFSLTAADGADVYDLWVEDGSGTELARLDSAVRAAPVPTIASVSPENPTVGMTFQIVLTGTGLAAMTSSSSTSPYRVRLRNSAGTTTSLTAQGTPSDTRWTSSEIWLDTETYGVEIYTRADTTKVVETAPGAVVVADWPAGEPTLASVSPTSGPIGTVVTFTGTGYYDGPEWRAKWYFGGTVRTSTATFVSETTITAPVPNNTAAGSGSVYLAWDSDSTADVGSKPFTVTAPVTQVEPAVAPTDTPVELHAFGEGLDQYADWGVQFDLPDPVDTLPAPIPAVSAGPLADTEVTLTVELPLEGKYNITAVDPEGNPVVLGIDLVVGDADAVLDE